MSEGLRVEAKHQLLASPFGRHIAQPDNSHSVWKPSINGCLDLMTTLSLFWQISGEVGLALIGADSEVLSQSPEQIAEVSAEPPEYLLLRCGLQIDQQLVLGRSLYRQVCRLLALEDAIDVRCRALELVELIGPIGDQATGSDKGTFKVDCG
jgi:hypothetical protein